MTSGLGSPTTSHRIMTVSPSTASVDLGLVTNNGTLEYLKQEWGALALQILNQLTTKPFQKVISLLFCGLQLHSNFGAFYFNVNSNSCPRASLL